MNNNMSDEQRSAAQEAIPTALHYMHQRLLEDGAAWRNELPVSATQAAHSLAEQTALRQAHARDGRMAMKRQASPIPQTPWRDVNWTRRLVASAAIFVMVGLLAALFASLAHGRHDQPLILGGHDASPTLPTPSSMPGPAAKYIVNVVTARSVDVNFTPIDISSRFAINSQVHVFIYVRNIPSGERHTVSVRWFRDGIAMSANGGPGRTSIQVTGDSTVHLAFLYSATGVGMAKIYWDHPANDTSDGDSDPSLAWTVYFAIEQPTSTPSAARAGALAFWRVAQPGAR